jgi:hypothetical protein
MRGIGLGWLGALVFSGCLLAEIGTVDSFGSGAGGSTCPWGTVWFDEGPCT